MINLAIIASHPIQYYAPLFRCISQDDLFNIRVFYLWDFGVTDQIDQGFKQSIKWDIPLLDGYDFEFVDNISKDRGTHHIFGLQNPSLTQQVLAFKPDAVLLTVSYNYASIYRFIWEMRNQNIPLIFRGDSHRIFTQSNWKSNLKNNLKNYLKNYFLSYLKKLFISKIFTNFEAFLYVGKANYNYFKYHDVPSKKLFFAPHSINYQFFTENISEVLVQSQKWRQELGIPITDSIILFAGKFEDKKRPLDLIRAFKIAKLQSVSLLIVGAGVLENEMRNLASQDGDRDQNIFFAPFQNQSLMPRTYAMADLFVLPSYGSGETWGLAINEAMGMGKPVIVSNHVGCAEDLVKPWRNGLIFEAGKVEALADSLREAFSDRDRLKQWGEESKKIIANYSYENVIAGLKQALAAIL